MEHASFTPLIFSTTGGIGNQASTSYSHVASRLSEKKRDPIFSYNQFTLLPFEFCSTTFVDLMYSWYSVFIYIEIAISVTSTNDT